MSQTALITGGQRGIGRAIATALHSAGFQIALIAEVASNDPDVNETMSKLPGARYYTQDLRQTDSLGGLLDRIEGDLGPLTTLISNAGVPAPVRGDLLDVTPENYDFTQAINARAGFFLAQNVARRMLARDTDGYRALCFVTSVSAEMVSVERGDYCISKSAAAMTAQLFAARLAGDGIGVFDIRPGIIDTPMTAGVRDAYTVRIEDGLVPARRWGQPDDIGSTILPLVTGQMAFATGAVIPVDGGLSIRRL
ncbi:3-ketoacyl-ACP reductase [Tropicimonas sp. S265A]|uniref:3-ketoacyl-ACP reductase n=1 Tax=Tropicimonas sp. S265A TaxID=3415134 RepID=UPI003C7B7E41